MDLQLIWNYFGKRFRPQRMLSFRNLMSIEPDTKVLDVGGTSYIWTLVPNLPTPTLCNVEFPQDAPGDVVIADALALPFTDQSWEVVFSNSAIEHVGTWENQKTFASEIQRVGRRFFVQTPAYEFPIEPHYLLPFFHWLPRWFRPYFALLSIRFRDGVEGNRLRVASLRLLRKRELFELFPGATISVERFLGLPKAYVVFKS